MQDPIGHVTEALSRHLEARPEDADRLTEIARRLRESPEGLFDRSCMEGHVTASGLLLSPDMRRALLIDHVALGRLLQPGGHYEAMATLLEEAIRECFEETGANGIRAVGPDGDLPLDVDTHVIPANPRKNEGEHLHHDFLFLLRMDDEEGLTAEKGAIAGLAWRDLADLAEGEDRLGRASRRAIERIGTIG